MFPRLLLALLLVFPAALAAPPSAAPDPGAVLDASPLVADDWRVGYQAQGAGESVMLLVNMEDGVDLGPWMDARGHPWHRPSREVSVFLATLPLAQVPDLLRLPGLTFVEADHPLEYHLATSTLDVQARGPGGAWRAGADGFEAPADLRRPLTGRGITVAVLDTGLDESHPDFGGYACTTPPGEAACQSRVLKKVKVDQIPYFVQAVGEVTPDTGFGDMMANTDWTSGHGTHTAGTVAGNGRMARDTPNPRDGGDGITVGVAPEADLISVGIGVGPWAGLSLAALGWVMDHRHLYDISVTSNSYGCVGGCAYRASGSRTEMVRTLYEEGVVSVWSNGNSYGTGDGAGMNGDAQIPWALGVAAYSDTTGRLASFSSRGDRTVMGLPDPRAWTPESEGESPPRRPDVAAPGVGIQAPSSATAGPRTYEHTGLEDRYVSMSGTSMAAPHVAGALALLAEACPSATALDRMRAVLVGADPGGVRKTAEGPGDLATEDWSHGDGPAEPWEAGHGALRIRASLDYLWDEVCPNADLRTPTGTDLPPVTLTQFQSGSAPLAHPNGTAIASVRGLPEGLRWDAGTQSVTGTAYHAGTYTLEARTERGSLWTRAEVAEAGLPHEVDPRQGVHGTLDAFGLQEAAVPPAVGTAFLRAPATLDVHLAACTTDCSPPGAGIPVGFTRGVGPDGAPAELRSQQSLPLLPDVRSIELGRGPVTFSIEAGAFAGGARIWVPEGGAFGYEPAPRLDLPAEVRLGPGRRLSLPLQWVGAEGSVELVEGPAGMRLERDALVWRSTEPVDAGVWLRVTGGDAVQEQGFRLVVAEPEASAPGVHREEAPALPVEPEGTPAGDDAPAPAAQGTGTLERDEPARLDAPTLPVPLVVLAALAVLAVRRRP